MTIVQSCRVWISSNVSVRRAGSEIVPASGSSKVMSCGTARDRGDLDALDLAAGEGGVHLARSLQDNRPRTGRLREILAGLARGRNFCPDAIVKGSFTRMPRSAAAAGSHVADAAAPAR